jgi:hypothetical protein
MAGTAPIVAGPGFQWPSPLVVRGPIAGLISLSGAGHPVTPDTPAFVASNGERSRAGAAVEGAWRVYHQFSAESTSRFPPMSRTQSTVRTSVDA